MTAFQRIVCLCPSLTEALFDMGAGERVVGVTDWCIHPMEECEKRTRVGGTKTPDLAKLFALQPDLVIVNEEENRLEDVEEIQARGIEILNTFPKTVADSATTLRAIGEKVGCVEAAESIAREIETEIEKTRASVADRPRLRFAYLIWRRPYMTVNRDTFANDLITIAGGANVFGDHATRYPKIAAEQLFNAKLDAIFLGSEPFMFTAPHAAEVCADAGLPPQRVVLADGELLSWYGSRTPAGIRYAREIVAKLTPRAYNSASGSS